MAIQPIKFLVSPSATATNGSKTITVTGNVDCSHVYSGTAIALGTRQVVEAVSGTKPDGSGNSVITLRDNWTDPTTTAKLVAFNTIEGLAEAIRRAREVVQASEAALSGNISYMGDHSAAPGNFPAAPGEGLGSHIYRISIAGTISDREYKVGELIYYDQYSSGWRPFNESLGTAAYKNVMNSPTDMTTPDPVMLRGAFGLGSLASPTSYVTNVDATNIPNGFYRVITEAIGTKPTGINQFTLIVARYNSTDSLQIAATTSGDLYFRHSANGVWTAWKKTLGVGDFGLGSSTSASVNDANIITTTGFYSVGATWTGSPTAGTSGSNQGYLKHQCWANDSYELQEFFSLTYAPQSYMWRLKDNGVWGAWNPVWTAANLTKQSSVNDVTAGRVLLTGAYGWGAAPTTGADWNSLNYSSINVSSTNAPAKAGTLTYMGLHIEGITAGQFSFDIAARNNRFFMQTKQAAAQQGWVELYHDKNIVGTVSQSAGVPTGAVYEKGSNPNGQYTKYADGSMIETKIIIASATANTFFSTTITWPISGGASGTAAVISSVSSTLSYDVLVPPSYNGDTLYFKASVTQNYTITLTRNSRWY